MNNLDKFPAEIKAVPHWCLAGKEKQPLTVVNSQLVNAEWKKNPNCLMPFEWAIYWASVFGLGIGYVIHSGDPFACVDLDVQENFLTPSGAMEPAFRSYFDRYQKIINAFDSYTEYSSSGRGIHIWVLGAIGLGCKRDGVEVYSQERFIVCTGNHIRGELSERQEWLDMLVADIRRQQNVSVSSKQVLIEVPETESDELIFERARTAWNADKFLKLWEGKWDELDYKSQSEADFALLSMFTFYTPSNAQVRRLFRYSGLGKREKATKNDVYINRSLEWIRSREAEERKVTEHGALLCKQLLEKKPESEAQLYTQDPLDFPPGAVGALAQYLHAIAVRQHKEIAIATAIAIFAGFCGKVWQTDGTGLNLYIAVLGKTGIGKEQISKGAATVVHEIIPHIPEVSNYINFDSFVSGPALRKGLSENNCFLNVVDEWGKKVTRLSSDKDGAMASLRDTLLAFYQKNTMGSISGGLVYSNKEGNVTSSTGVAYSMIGDSTPEEYYEALTKKSMQDGFLSRFLIVDCKNGLPPRNKHGYKLKMDKQLAQYLAAIVGFAVGNSRAGVCQPVEYADQEAHDFMDKIERETEAIVNGLGQKDLELSAWNRSCLNIIKISSLLAIGENYTHPKITTQHIQWAMTICKNSTYAILERLANGEIGEGDHSRALHVVRLLADYINGKTSYKPKEEYKLYHDGVISYSHLCKALLRRKIFDENRIGGVNAINLTIKSLIEQGYLLEIAKATAIERYGFHGRCFKILSVNTDM